ncbi:glycoside hydrolase family 53 protein [Aquisalinus flavus]|uniref:Arabinogalactan endo-beta-1,4-galactanase n=1 Tax=Aquisalinus flavus TaxID=1526572 RepID=A0A8J2Y5I7_9PROT|nr:glycosyl hydrolase 53 family protein [Aquisalinus flavus]MBD0427109.1 glycosyl hydrolase 53 family protein [Aquisalinus flavus]GGC98465.1 arabinogalactan endo-beta-1,4-galactanase [Aquisalinus flavus]
MTFLQFLMPAIVTGLVSVSAVAEQNDTPAARTFYLGSDLSYANEMDDCGAVFRQDAEVRDVYEIFADEGNNLVRLRLWHDPQWTDYSTLDDVKRSIARAKASGMQVLLDFHYSDDWADPGDQIIPAAWADIETDEALAEALFAYTRDTLIELREEGLSPDMVQVGNETNTEILLPANVPEDTPVNWTRNVMLLNAGIRGVREAGKLTGHMPAIMLHVAQPEHLETWFDDAFAAGILDFDYIGMSYYPKWSSLGMEEMGQTLRRLRHKYGKEVIVVETAYPWTLEADDAAPNILNEDSLIPAYPATLDGQRAFLTELTQTVISNDGSGVVYWEPAWVANGCSTRWGDGSHWENNAFFEYGGTNAHSGFDFFTHEYEQPVQVTFVFAPPTDYQHGDMPPLYFWASFFEGKDFTVALEPENGGYRYEARLPAGEAIKYRLFKSPDLTDPIIMGSDMTDQPAEFVVGDGTLGKHGVAVSIFP